MSSLLIILLIVGIIGITVFIFCEVLFNICLKRNSFIGQVFNKVCHMYPSIYQIDYNWWKTIKLEEKYFTVRRFFTSKSSYVLKTYYIKQQSFNSNKVAIVVHGYNQEYKDMQRYVKLFYDQGYDVYIPILRGHGESEGKVISMGWLDRWDIKKLLKIVSREYEQKGNKIVLKINKKYFNNNKKYFYNNLAHNFAINNNYNYRYKKYLKNNLKINKESKKPNIIAKKHFLKANNKKIIFKYLKNIFKNNTSKVKIVLFGLSMGASTVCLASAFKLSSKIKCIISDSAYSNPYKLFDTISTENGLPKFFLPILNIYARVRLGYKISDIDVAKEISKCKYPILFIHGTKDNFVPYEMCIELFESCNSLKEIKSFDCGHGECLPQFPVEYEREVKSFLGKYVHD